MLTPEPRAQLLKNVSAEDYHADELPGSPRLSRSIAVKLLQQSPRHAFAAHPQLGGAPGVDEAAEDEPEKVKRLETGSLLHTLLLGHGAKVAVVEADSWRTNAAKDAREEARANGLLPVLAPKYYVALATSKEIRKSLQGYGVVLEEYEPEVTCLWTTERGAAAKCRMDALSLGQGTVLDLKIQPRVSLGSFERGILGLGLDIQAASYQEGLAAVYPEIAGRTSFTFLLCEYLPPFDVALVSLAANFLDLGAQRWARAQKIWKGCLASGVWPGVGVQPPVEAKPWHLEAEFAAAMDAIGEPDWAKGV